MLKQAIAVIAIAALGLVSAQDNPTAPSACAVSASVLTNLLSLIITWSFTKLWFGPLCNY
jgi:hypothetical protein